MFYSVDLHLTQYRDSLVAEDLDDADVVFGVRVASEDTISEDLV